jgi:hypothetical protein
VSRWPPRAGPEAKRQGALRAHRARQQQDWAAAGDTWTDPGLVFTTAIGGHLEPPNLNTTSARLLARTVRCTTMNTYGHVIPAMQHEAAGHMDAALGDDLADDEDGTDGN